MSYRTCDNVSPECPVEYTIYGDYFTLGATATYAALFGTMMVIQAVFAYRAKTWSFGAWLFAGTAFECMGYIGRSAMTQNPWNFEAFILQNLCLVLGPTIVAAAISLTFKHLVLWFGPEHSLLAAKWYPWVFVGTDVISFCIQSTGGGIASSGDSPSMFTLGNNLLLAGVCFQVANMVFCGGLILIYVWRRKRAMTIGPIQMASEWNAGRDDVPPCCRGTAAEVVARRKKVLIFITALAVAYVAIIARCIYRIPEMAMGWGSTLMQNETTFMTLDGGMLLIACSALTIFHPLFLFPVMGKGYVEAKKEPSELELSSRQADVSETAV